MPTDENFVRAEVSAAIDRKLAKDEAIHAYVEKVAGEVASKAINARLSPFYKHPTFQNIVAVVIGALAIFGVSLAWSDLIRPPILSFLQIDAKVGEAVQKRQYEVYEGAFELGAHSQLVIEDNDVCNELKLNYLLDNDIVVPRSAFHKFSPTCVRFDTDVVRAGDVSFIARAGEAVDIAVLVIARTAPSVDAGFEGEAFSLTRLLTAVAEGGETVGRRIDLRDVVKVRLDRDELALQVADSLVPVRDAATNEVYDYVLFWVRHTIGENSGQFHNLTVSLADESADESFGKSLVVRVFLERNKL